MMDEIDKVLGSAHGQQLPTQMLEMQGYVSGLDALCGTYVNS